VEHWKKQLYQQSANKCRIERNASWEATCVLCTYAKGTSTHVFAVRKCFFSSSTIAIHALRFPAYIARYIIILSTRRWIGKSKTNFLENRSKLALIPARRGRETRIGEIMVRDHRRWGRNRRTPIARSEIVLNFEDDVRVPKRKKAQNLLVDTHE